MSTSSLDFSLLNEKKYESFLNEIDNTLSKSFKWAPELTKTKVKKIGTALVFGYNWNSDTFFINIEALSNLQIQLKHIQEIQIGIDPIVRFIINIPQDLLSESILSEKRPSTLLEVTPNKKVKLEPSSTKIPTNTKSPQNTSYNNPSMSVKKPIKRNTTNAINGRNQSNGLQRIQKTYYVDNNYEDDSDDEDDSDEKEVYPTHESKYPSEDYQSNPRRRRQHSNFRHNGRDMPYKRNNNQNRLALPYEGKKILQNYGNVFDQVSLQNNQSKGHYNSILD